MTILECSFCDAPSNSRDCNAYEIKIFNPKTKDLESKGYFWECNYCGNDRNKFPPEADIIVYGT